MKFISNTKYISSVIINKYNVSEQILFPEKLRYLIKPGLCRNDKTTTFFTKTLVDLLWQTVLDKNKKVYFAMFRRNIRNI